MTSTTPAAERLSVLRSSPGKGFRSSAYMPAPTTGMAEARRTVAAWRRMRAPAVSAERTRTSVAARANE